MKVYDKDIRKILYKKFLQTKEFTNDPSTLIIDEFTVCKGLSRADIAVINGKIHCYEIKSERDTLERLPTQIIYYNKVFDKVTIVVDEKYLDKVSQIVPEWWGIYYVIKKNNELSIKRKRVSKNNKEIIIEDLLQLLWKDELIELLRIYGITKGVKGKNIRALIKLAAENIKEKDIKMYVKEQLKNRDGWRAMKLTEFIEGKGDE